MIVHLNLPAKLCGLLALSAVGLSLPKVINVMAEDFVHMKEIHVRVDGTPINQTNPIDLVCGGCQTTYSYTKVGTGNPHQNFVITQKGGTLVACDTSSTSTGTGYSTTLGWSLSLGVNTPFESAGFSISESQTYSVSNIFNCNGVAAEGGDICVLFYQAVTAFTVTVKQVHSCACGDTTSTNRGQAVVYAPNSNQVLDGGSMLSNMVLSSVSGTLIGKWNITVGLLEGLTGGPAEGRVRGLMPM